MQRDGVIGDAAVAAAAQEWEEEEQIGGFHVTEANAANQVTVEGLDEVPGDGADESVFGISTHPSVALDEQTDHPTDRDFEIAEQESLPYFGEDSDVGPDIGPDPKGPAVEFRPPAPAAASTSSGSAVLITPATATSMHLTSCLEGMAAGTPSPALPVNREPLIAAVDPDGVPQVD